MSSTTPPDAAASNPALTTPCPGAAPGGVTMRFGQSPTTGEHAFSVEPEPPPPCVPAPAIGHSLRCVDCGGPMTEADRGTADEAGREAHAFGKCHPLPAPGPLLSVAELAAIIAEATELATYYANLGPMPVDPGSRLAFARAVLHLSGLLATPLPEDLAEAEHAAELQGDVSGERYHALMDKVFAGLRAQAATIREQAGEIARLRKLAEAERALRLTERDLCVRATKRAVCGVLALDGACQDARVALTAAGGTP